LYPDTAHLTGEDIDGDGVEDFLGQYFQQPNSLFVEDAPAKRVRLRWSTLKKAADEAGASRIYGGIHIQDGDLRGRELGKKIGRSAWRKANDYFQGNTVVE